MKSKGEGVPEFTTERLMAKFVFEIFIVVIAMAKIYNPLFTTEY